MTRNLVNDLKKQFAGVFLDGENEHGTHVIRLSDWGMDGADFDELLDPTERDAKQIMEDAIKAGFQENHAVITLWRWIYGGFDDPDEVEYLGISVPLTHAIYGTPQEQDEEFKIAETAV